MKELLYKHRHELMVTIIFHLLFFIILLSLELKKVVIYEETSIELVSETIKKLEEKKEIEKKIEEIRKKVSDSEVEKMLRSIAVNEDIKPSKNQENVQNYIDEYQKEISQNDYGDRYKHKKDKDFTKDSLQNANDNKLQKLDSLKSTFYSGKSSVSYSLKGRYAVYLPIPVFKCPEGGLVEVEIWVNEDGRVQKAKVKGENLSKDECINEVAYSAALRSRFNAKSGAKLEVGTITYRFVKQ